MSSRDINLDGGEISILKALGSSSSETMGRDLIEKVAIDLAPAEVIDTIKGLMAMGYVDADKNGFYSVEELEPIYFRINSGYAKDLKDAMNPQPEKPKSKRVRRE